MYQQVKDYLHSIRGVWSLDAQRRAARTIRYLVRGLSHPAAAAYWSSAICRNPVLRYWSSHNPRLWQKPSRHYLNRSYTYDDRARIIETHYQLIGNLLSQNAIEALARGLLITLAEFSGKSGNPYRVVLRKTNKFDREGELALVLESLAEQRTVYAVAFSLDGRHHDKSLEIGCLQGGNSPGGRELIRRATKECYGLQPRRLLLEIIYSLAGSWNIQSVFGVTNDCRVYKSKAVFADYDAFWADIGGEVVHRGRFRLPPTLRHSALSEIESKRRSEHRRKVLLRETVNTLVQTTLSDMSGCTSGVAFCDDNASVTLRIASIWTVKAATAAPR